MKEIRYFYVPQASSVNELPEEEAKHAVKVLRLQAGDTIHIVDGEGGLFEAEVTMASGRHCMYNIFLLNIPKRNGRARFVLESPLPR